MSIDPAELEIVHYPDPVLRRKTRPVETFDAHLQQVADRMIHLMHEAEGIGLAAPQVGLDWRMFVVDIPAGEGRSPATTPPTATDGPRVYINPRLSGPAGTLEIMEEGCLSLPDITGEVLRPPVITITAQDLDGKEFTQTAAGLLARCLQHEFDHIEGVLIIDRMSQASRLRTRSAVRSLEKAAGKR